MSRRDQNTCLHREDLKCSWYFTPQIASRALELDYPLCRRPNLALYHRFRRRVWVLGRRRPLAASSTAATGCPNSRLLPFQPSNCRKRCSAGRELSVLLLLRVLLVVRDRDPHKEPQSRKFRLPFRKPHQFIYTPFIYTPCQSVPFQVLL